MSEWSLVGTRSVKQLWPASLIHSMSLRSISVNTTIRIIRAEYLKKGGFKLFECKTGEERTLGVGQKNDISCTRNVNRGRGRGGGIEKELWVFNGDGETRIPTEGQSHSKERLLDSFRPTVFFFFLHSTLSLLCLFIIYHSIFFIF